MSSSPLRLSLVSLGFVLASSCGKKKSAPTDDPTAAGKPTPVATTKGVKAALGGGGAGGAPFTPSTEGFKFENYGNDLGYENLTPAELERLFGDQVCGDREGDTCILTPPAERWMLEINKGMGGGHCEGLAAMALLFRIGKLQATDFGAPTAFALAIENNKKLQHEIAFWWSTQAIAPMKAAEIKTLTPSQVVDKLTEAFQTGKESYTIGIYKLDGSGGHATTPYAIVDKNDHETWIMQYDNNFPGVERHIDVDRKANTWKYFTAADPSQPGEVYEGTAASFSLTIAPTSVRTGKLECPFCGDVDGDANGAKGSRQIIMDGDADLLVTDDTGKRIGHAGGKLVNEIPGAQIVETKAGFRSSEHEPIYELPQGHPLTVTLDGTALKAKQATDVSLIGQGYTMGVYGVALSPGEKDTLQFSADWKEISYQTEQDETPELAIGVETSGADYEFDIQAGGEAGGQRIDLSLDVKTGTLSVQATAKDGAASYEVEIHRIAKGGEQVFKHKGVASHGNDKFVFHYADWKGKGQPMKAGVDKSGDGSIDEDEELADEE